MHLRNAATVPVRSARNQLGNKRPSPRNESKKLIGIADFELQKFELITKNSDAGYHEGTKTQKFNLAAFVVGKFLSSL